MDRKALTTFALGGLAIAGWVSWLISKKQCMNLAHENTLRGYDLAILVSFVHARHWKTGNMLPSDNSTVDRADELWESITNYL